MTTESTNPKDVLGQKKPPLHLNPTAALIHMAMAMKDGAKKYGPFNWRKKTVSASIYVGAAQRHILAWFDGEENADDSGVHHLAHAMASLAILIDAQETDSLHDDRPSPGPTARLLEKFTEQPKKARAGLIRFCKQPDASNDFDAGVLKFCSDNGIHMFHDVPIQYVEKLGSPPRKPRCYLAGPMRGMPYLNFPAFDEARDNALHLGWDPISPADMDRDNGIYEDFDPAEAAKPEVVRSFVERDTKALLSLRAEKGDAIVMLPGWEESTGASAEFFVAKWLGLMILDANTFEPFIHYAATNINLAVLCYDMRRAMGGNK